MPSSDGCWASPVFVPALWLAAVRGDKRGVWRGVPGAVPVRDRSLHAHNTSRLEGGARPAAPIVYFEGV